MAARSGTKGLDLEEALKAYFWQAGYFAVRGVPFRLDAEDVTDIDLWLYERPAASTRRRLIVDAKNRNSPKAAERLIWTKGLAAALHVDGAVVATTDKRLSTRRLSKILEITLLDGDAVSKLTQSEQLREVSQLRSEEFDSAVRAVDKARRSTDWLRNLRDARGSLISGLGAQSANWNLSAAGFFGDQVLQAQPQSTQAQVALRLFYLTSAFAAISLDYVLADLAFRSKEEQRLSVLNCIRFGQSDSVDALATVRVALGLARKYLNNGAAGAKQIEYGFHTEAERIPAEIIADFVVQISATDALFNVAREIERASSGIELIPYDTMSIDARSLLGVFLDFNGIPREAIANAWKSDPFARHSGPKTDVQVSENRALSPHTKPESLQESAHDDEFNLTPDKG